MVACFAYDERALIERYIAGTELAVSVVDTGEGPRALPPVEVVTDGQYDFDARYNPGRSEYFVPARLDEAVIEKVKKTAITVHTTLGLGNLSRTDLTLDDKGTPCCPLPQRPRAPWTTCMTRWRGIHWFIRNTGSVSRETVAPLLSSGATAVFIEHFSGRQADVTIGPSFSTTLHHE